MEPPRVVGRRILLVEDDQAARESVKLLLAIDRHTVAEAGDTVQALEFFEREPFDLVITDYYMPGNSGAELAAQIKRLAPHQPVLLLSAFIEKLGGACPATDAVLAKPFSIGDLRRVISSLLPPALDAQGSGLTPELAPLAAAWAQVQAA